MTESGLGSESVAGAGSSDAKPRNVTAGEDSAVRASPPALALLALCAALSLLIGWGASELYRLFNEEAFRAEMASNLLREAASMRERTLVGRGMGMVALAGKNDPAIREAALATDIEQAKRQSKQHPALRVLADSAGAEHAFVANRSGIITADWDYKGNSPIGQDVSFRTYTKAALQGVESVWGGESLSTGRRTYYVAAPVYADTHGASVTGVVAARFDAKELDAFLGRVPHALGLFVSPTGVVFASSRTDWLLRVTPPGLSAAASKAIIATKQFRAGFAKAEEVPILPFGIESPTVTVDGKRYAVFREAIDWRDQVGHWTMVLLGDLSIAASANRRLAIGATTALAALLLLAYALWAQRGRAQRRALEKQARESEQQMQAIIDNVPGIVYRCLPRHPWTMLFISEEIEKVTGYPASDFLGASPVRTFGGIMHPDDIEPIAENTARGVAERRPYTNEYRVIDTAGHVHWVYAKGKAIYDAQGEPAFLDGVIFDISERKQTERELVEAKDAADAANRAKSLFLSNMTHELRTPLNAILGFSDLLRRSPGLTETQHANLAIIHKSGDHLLGLINDVLDLAKIEAGRTQIERAPFDLANLVDDIADMMRVRAEEKGLQLCVDRTPDLPRHVIDDQAKLRQILFNLLSNAVKATERGGVALRLGVEPGPAERLILEVEDTGIGIAPEDQRRVFEAFVQSGAPGKWQGTGLGLAITRLLIELMGGRLTLSSEVGKGSAFRVELPLQRARPEDLPEDLPEQGEVIGLEPGQPNYRVLVVDDNLENRLLLKQLLVGVGYAVKEAENGAEAVARFRDWQPHFICMDQRMPVMEGAEATRRIRALPGGDAVKIAAVTASSFKQDDAMLLGAGFDAIVHKPFRPEEIHQCMETLLGVKLVRATPAAVEQACEPTSQSLDTLPEALRQALAEAITNLDGERIQTVLAEIGKAQPGLAAKLGRLADNYNYQPILDLLERATAANP